MDKIIFNRTCFFGPGSIKEIPNEISSRHLTKCFIVTDQGMLSAGLYQKILNVFLVSKIPSVLFSDVSGEPSIREIKNAFFELKKSKADFVLAIGGGSVIDTAKAICVMMTNPKFEDVISLSGKKDNIISPLPLFAVPTTAGSGAEVSKSIVITDDFSRKKIICSSDKILPITTFIDSELMLTMPDIVTLSSGLDAFTHAIESLICNKSNMFSESFSKQAIELIYKYLPECYDEPENLNARQKMAYSGYIAGIAYTNSGLGLCHSIAHAIAGKYSIPHGIALAISLPSILKYNMYSPASTKYELIASALSISTENLSREQICRSVIKKVEAFINDFNIPKKFSEYGLREEDLNSVALLAYEDACTNTNPRETSVTDIYMLLKKLL